MLNQEEIEKLTELSENIKSQLDSSSFSSKYTNNFIPPKEAKSFVKCCGSYEEKRVKVKFKYTKCSPPDPCFLCSILNAEPFESHKMSVWKGKKLTTSLLCVTSEGPWEGILIEEVTCTSAIKKNTLSLKTGNEIKSFVFFGDTFPDGFELIECITKGKTNYSCGGLSTCDCSSYPCTQNCNCK